MSNHGATGVLYTAALAVFLLSACMPVDTTYKDPGHAKLAAAGIVEKTAAVGDVAFDYAEGPDNGPPLLLLHANFTIMDDGTRNGAMDQADADRAMSLLAKGTSVRVDSEHVVHLDKPAEFIRLIESFFLPE